MRGMQTVNSHSLLLVYALTTLTSACSNSETKFTGSPREEKILEKTEDLSQVEISPTPQPLPNPIPVSNGSNDAFIGGSNQMFHIGDGDFDKGSACYNEVAAMGLTGTTYIFPFKVTDNATLTSISIDRICGTDLGNNYIHLYKDGALVGSQAIGKGAASHNFTPTPLLFDIGEYQIHVASTKTKGLFYSDFDDFLVGNVRIHANKNALVPGNVMTR